MMSRPSESAKAQNAKRHRGTLQILDLVRKYGLTAAMSINNIGNAFTPYGSCNPLRLANLGVGVYQASTKQAVESLYVSQRCYVGQAC